MAYAIIRTFMKNLYEYVLYVICNVLTLALQWDWAIIMSIKLDTNLKMYVEIAGYLVSA